MNPTVAESEHPDREYPALDPEVLTNTEAAARLHTLLNQHTNEHPPPMHTPPLEEPLLLSDTPLESP